jgi:RNase P protein component
MVSPPLKGVERLLKYLRNQGNNYHVNLQLAHLDSALNRQKLRTNAEYRNTYNRIKAFIGPNFNARTARGKNALRLKSAKLIQRHWRGTSARKPKFVLVQNPNNGNLMLATTIVRAPILKKIHRNKVARNIAAAEN